MGAGDDAMTAESSRQKAISEANIAALASLRELRPASVRALWALATSEFDDDELWVVSWKIANLAKKIDELLEKLEP